MLIVIILLLVILLIGLVEILSIKLWKNPINKIGITKLLVEVSINFILILAILLKLNS